MVPGAGLFRDQPSQLLTTRVELGWYRGEDIVARLLAATAGLCAHPAVLVVPSVVLALLTAKAASLRASLETGAQHPRLRGRLPGEDPAGRLAHIGAVEVEPDAASQHLHVPLSDAGVGAGGASLGAVEARLDALYERGTSTEASLGLVWIICCARVIDISFPRTLACPDRGTPHP